MTDDNKKPAAKPRRFIKKENIILDFIKVLVLAVVIALAGWGVMVRGERLRQAEVIADIASSGVNRVEKLTNLKNMIDNGDLQEAIVELLPITREEPENFVAHYLLGVAYAKKGLSAEALACFDRVLELGGWEAQVHYNRGVVYESLGFYDKAYLEYEAAREADPAKREYLRARDKVDYVIQADLGLDSQYQFRFNEASAALIRVPPDLEFASNTFEYLVENFPHKVEPLHMLGVVRSKQGLVDEAEEIFKRAIEMEPGFALSYYNLGILYQTRGRWEEARDYFLHCLRLTPDDKNRAVVTSHIVQVEKHIPGFNGDS